MAFSPVAGAALSDDTLSPNFIFTQKEKDVLKRSSRNSRTILLGFAAFMVACFGFYLWQQADIGKKNKQIEQLSAELNTFKPQVDKPDILKLVNATNAKRKQLQQYAEKYTSLAVISDLAHRVHPDVRLIHMELTLPEPIPAPVETTKKEKSKKAAAPEPEPRRIKLEGIVMGSRATFESALTEYLIGLKNSLLLSNPQVKDRAYEFFENEEVLRFTATLDVV